MRAFERDVWKTVGTVEGFTDLSLEVGGGGGGDTFTVTCRRIADGAQVVLSGGVRDGKVDFNHFEIDVERMISDSSRVPIGLFRQEITLLVKKHADSMDVHTQVLSNHGPELTSEEQSEFASRSAHAQEVTAQYKEKLTSTGRLSGRPPLPDEHWARVSETYLNLYPTHRRRVAVAVADQLRTEGYRDSLPLSTVKTWIMRCRRLGWLAQTGGTKPRGEAGPRLIEWRKADEADR